MRKDCHGKSNHSHGSHETNDSAGAAALISQVRRELMTGEVGWETTALRMIAVSLAQMEAA